MVKPADDHSGVFFAPPGDCTHWAFIPKGAIEDIQGAGHSRCGGHFHALAEIHLKPPTSELENAYASIADLHRTKLAQFSEKTLRPNLTISILKANNGHTTISREVGFANKAWFTDC